jgi:hypothetical protein
MIDNIDFIDRTCIIKMSKCVSATTKNLSNTLNDIETRYAALNKWPRKLKKMKNKCLKMICDINERNDVGDILRIPSLKIRNRLIKSIRLKVIDLSILHCKICKELVKYPVSGKGYINRTQINPESYKIYDFTSHTLTGGQNIS